MNRRKFLKLAGVGGAAILLPLPALSAEWPKTAPLPGTTDMQKLLAGWDGQTVIGGSNPSTETFWRNNPDTEALIVEAAETLQPQLAAKVAENYLRGGWWALEDLNILSPVSGVVTVNQKPLCAFSQGRRMWPSTSGLLFPAEAKFQLNPAPQYWAAVVRAPEQQFFMISDNTGGDYHPLQNPDVPANYAWWYQ